MGKVLGPVLSVVGYVVAGPLGAVVGAVAGGALGNAIAPARATTALTPFDPKSVNPDPAASRKLVLGRTVFPVDLRYAEPSGTNQEYIDYVFALAAHKSDGIESIYIEDDLAWTVGGGAQGKFAGYLTVEVILEAGSGAFHTVNAGTTWGSSTRLTGCTTMKVRVKRSDNSKTSQSPFGNGISGRWSVIGRGMPVYDPAQDSTQPGGSGSQRANDNATWAYTSGTTRGNNPALQLLSFLLGWRIGGRVSVGVGLPADTIDIASFATAAALCDESVALAGGGSHRRYEAGRAFADSDDPLGVVRVLLDGMNGELVDDGGRLSLRLAVNDLTAAVTLTDDDFVSGYEWRPAAPIEQQYTVVRGRYSQPDAPALFSLVDYPEVEIPRTSLAPRPFTLELSAVQDQRRAERIAKQAAVRNLYQGTFTVTLGARGWLLRRNMVVAVNSAVRGWTNKLFRVRSLTFNADATVNVTLREENAAIYAWSASESAVVLPVVPVVFDSRKAASWLMADIAPGANLTAPNGVNLVPFSRMEGDQGWAVVFNPSNLAQTLEFGNFQGLRFVKSTATATAANQELSLGTNPSSRPSFKLNPLERVLVQARVENAGAAQGDWQLQLWGFEADGVTQTIIGSLSGTPTAITSGTVFFFVDVPAGYFSGRLEFKGFSSGAGSFQIAISEPMVAQVLPNQTLRPAFTPGPNAVDGADVTRDTLPAVGVGAWMVGIGYGRGAVVTDANAIWTARIANTATNANRPGLDGTWALFSGSPDSGNLATSASAFFNSGVISSTSYGSAAATITVKAGSGGTVDLSINGGVSLETGSSASAAAKIQRETTPGTWVDVGAEATSATVTDANIEARTAAFSFTRQATGLTNGTAYNFRVLVRRGAAAAGTEVQSDGLLTGVGR